MVVNLDKKEYMDLRAIGRQKNIADFIETNGGCVLLLFVVVVFWGGEGEWL